MTEKTADRARVYLNRHNVQAEWIVKRGRAAARIIAAARQRDCGLVLMGGYGLNPVLEIVAGSVVDEVLRTRNRPVLVCR